MTDKYYVNPPDKCDLCSAPIDRFLYDVALPLHRGSWANICQICYINSTARLGPGKGQKFERQEDGRYKLIAGGSSDV